MNNRGRILGHFIFLIEGISLGLFWSKSVYQIKSVSTFCYSVKVSEFSIASAATSVLVSLLFLYVMKKKRSNSLESKRLNMDFEIAFLPLLIGIPFFFIPCGIYTPLFLIGAIALSIFRYIASFQKARKFPELKISHCLILIFIVFAFFIFYEAFLQQKCLDSLILNYSDWGIYSNAVDNTLKGKFFYSNELGRNYLGHHFMPGAFLIMAPVIALFRTPFAVFAFNSFILYSGAFVIFALALKKDLPKICALVLALAYCLCPSLSNMALSMFYGFHPVYIAMPLIALFFLFYERRNFVPAFLIFLFSLTIKETVPIFWIGAGAALFIRGDKKKGSIIALTSVAYFLLTTLWIMPAISGKEQYEFVSRFQHLGGSFTEIAFSPFTKPLIFIKTLFRTQNIFYLCILAVPVYIITFNTRLILGVALILSFSLLQQSNQLSHLGNQYQSEALMLIYVSAVYGFCNALKFSGETSFFKLLLAGIKRGENFVKNLPVALASSLLFSCIFSFFFFGYFIVGKNSDMLLWSAPSMREEILELKKSIPKEASLTATPSLGANFVFRNDVFLYYNRPLKDFILIDLSDRFAHAQLLEDLRCELVSSGKNKLLKSGGNILLYGKKEAGEPYETPKPGIIKIPLEKWQSGRDSMPTEIPEIEYKVLWGKGSGKNLKLLFRVMKKINYDFDIEVATVKDPQAKEDIKFYSFGDGVFPAYLAEPGDAFIVEYPLKLWGFTVGARLIPKPKPSQLGK